MQTEELSTSVPLGHIATVTASREQVTQLDTITVRLRARLVSRDAYVGLTVGVPRPQVLCKDFRTLVFAFEPVHTVRHAHVLCAPCACE